MGDDLARAKLARAAVCLNRGTLLPALIFLTDDERSASPLDAVRRLPRGSLVILRSRSRSRRTALARGIAPVARERGICWLVADDPDLASSVGAHGAHFPEAHTAEAHRWRARHPGWLITCAAHSLGACARAAIAGADAVLLSPVFATQSHEGRLPLGPLRSRLIALQSPVPAYALGGVDARSAAQLRDAPFAGLAAISALTR